MPLNQQDINHIVKAFQASQKPKNVFIRFQPTWAALVIIFAIFIAEYYVESVISLELSAQTSPLMKEMSDGFMKINHSLNGKPEAMPKGIKKD